MFATEEGNMPLLAANTNQSALREGWSLISLPPIHDEILMVLCLDFLNLLRNTYRRDPSNGWSRGTMYMFIDIANHKKTTDVNKAIVID